MPSTVTHAYFALDVFDKLNEKTKKHIKNNIEDLKTLAQGPDPLYFYNLVFPFTKQNIRKQYPRKVHDTNTRNFFITLVKEIKEQKLKNNGQTISLLYGFISHYVLDSTIHPYIVYKTGEYKKDVRDTQKYRSLHLDMELYIDGYMIFQREKIPIQKFKMYQFCFNINIIEPKVKKLLDSTVKEVYDLDNYSKYYFKAIKQMKKIYKIFRYDRFGIKRVLYIMLDKVLSKNQLKKEQLSYHINYKKKLHYLNNEKNEWNHPMDQYETYNYSFIELYHIALNKALKIIDDVNKVIYDDEDISILNNTFKNLSHKTGKECNDTRELKYFEY